MINVEIGDLVGFINTPNFYYYGIITNIRDKNIHVYWLHREEVVHYRGLGDLMPEVVLISTTGRE